MKIVEDNPKRVKCVCGKILEYEDEDVQMFENLKYIKCPVCNTNLSITPLTYYDLKKYAKQLNCEYRPI